MSRSFVIVSPNFYPRVCGVGDHSARLGDELRRRGHQVAVLSRGPVEPNPVAPEVEAQAAAGQLPLVIARNAARAIAARRPTDVVVQYTAQMWDAWRFGSPAVPLLAASARRGGARVTLIAHEPFVPWARRPDLALAAATQRLHMAALLAAAHRSFVTTGTRVPYVEPLSRLVGAPAPGVIRVGANALPVERPARAPSPSPSGPRLGIFSTAATGKRFDVVLDAFAAVSAARPGAELVLIGDLGASHLPRVREIEQAVRRHPAAARIRTTGRLPLPGVAAEMAALDVYLFPMDTGANTRSGTLPVALGSGLPVIAVSGPETDAALFRDGDNVVLARALTGAAFAEAALRVLDDPALAARVAAGARRLYHEHLSWSTIADQVLAE